MIDALTAIMWIAGSAFALLAAVGVLRLPDVFTRMQASTKASTLGLGCLLMGAALQLGDFGAFIRLASIGAFIVLTTSVAAHVIARASYMADVPLWAGTVLDERRRDAGVTPQPGAKPTPAATPSDAEPDSGHGWRRPPGAP